MFSKNTFLSITTLNWFHFIWNDNNQVTISFFFLCILSLLYPVFLNFSGDFRYGFLLWSSPQFELSLHTLGKLELRLQWSIFQSKACCCKITYGSVQIIKHSLLWSKTRTGGCPTTGTGRKTHLWIMTGAGGWGGLEGSVGCVQNQLWMKAQGLKC